MINYIDNDELPIGFTMELALHSDIPEPNSPIWTKRARSRS